jgi:hypothetical protein
MKIVEGGTLFSFLSKQLGKVESVKDGERKGVQLGFPGGCLSIFLMTSCPGGSGFMWTYCHERFWAGIKILSYHSAHQMMPLSSLFCDLQMMAGHT